MTVSFDVTRWDYVAFFTDYGLRRTPKYWIVSGLAALFGVLRMLPVPTGVDAWGLSFFAAFTAVNALFWASLPWLFLTLYALVYAVRSDRVFLGRHTITLRPDVIANETAVTRGEAQWTAVSRVVRTGRHGFIYVGRTRAYVIPRRSFDLPEAWDEFFATAERFRLQARAGASEGGMR